MKSYIGLVTVLLLISHQVTSYQPAPKVGSDSKYSSKYDGLSGYKHEKKSYFGQDLDENDHMDDRIQITEPYKTLIQTSARLALTQSGASKHVNVDMAMDLLSDTSYMLAKPSTLSKFFKAITVIFATILTSAFLFPGAYKIVDSAWRNPQLTLKRLEGRYLPNGINEKTIVNLVGSRMSDFINSLGLTDSSCQEQSVCQAGELLKCYLPHTSEFLIKFVDDHFSRPRYRENRYINAFLLGFVERNCVSFSSQTSSNTASGGEGSNDSKRSKSCFGNLFNSFIQTRCGGNNTTTTSNQQRDSGLPLKKVEFQTIQAGRA